MTKRILFILLALVLAVSISLIGCNGGQQEEEEEEEEEPEVFELTFANIHPSVDPFNSVVNDAWIKWIEEESEGRIQITLISDSAAAAPPDMYDAAKTGIVDIACHLVTFTPGSFNIPFVSTLPFCVESPGARASGLALMELYEEYPEFQAEFEGVKVLLFHCPDDFQIAMADTPIHTAADFDGKVIEAQTTAIAGMLTALGASPEFIGMEAADAIQKGTLDGTLHNWTGFLVFGFLDACNYFTECDFAGPPAFVHVMNQDTWNSLPSDLQELFVGDNAWTLAELYGYQVDKQTLEYRALVDETIQGRGYPEIYVLPEDEKANWREITSPVYDDWVQTTGSVIGEDKAEDILEDYLELTEKYSWENWPRDWQEDTLQEWGAL